MALQKQYLIHLARMMADMDLLKEIRNNFAGTQSGAWALDSLPDKYPAHAVRFAGEYGIILKCNDELLISERFANCHLYTRRLLINGVENNYLFFSSNMDSLRHEFAVVCAQFAEPGENGIERENLLKNPIEWWQNWKELMGNAIRSFKTYDVIAEMAALEYLYLQDNSVVWEAVTGGSHDIESVSASYEVKSTVKKYDTNITISGQHQLTSAKKLYLLFCRMEKSISGVSIDDMFERLVARGYDSCKLEQQLELIGFEKGCSARAEKYRILEKRRYEVNDDFPKITDESFKGDKMPQGITKITYTVNLDGLPYTTW